MTKGSGGTDGCGGGGGGGEHTIIFRTWSHAGSVMLRLQSVLRAPCDFGGPPEVR